ncbi:unnamed protein product (macronuclear) [Paramecium tetraurelia]|uniref:Oxidation resistance protein 1 n=1 Tax=Paramecium tetraurelia TaxID=5888 RepID=A0C0N8_PARTE|nr:uncharacterized protein GSPATT00006208001 [Paramecium tetraurelia]CAK64355.1 unnamed protein product [Paramecium tetraurelia]|eukprot:XP_001431753.1 hypothetical protein (macronuclear) [Paramecium tetraurelia strain d4-2]
MGNCVQERKPQHTLFDAQELKKLNQVFDHYCDLQTDTRKNRHLSQQSFEEIFVENADLGRKLFRFLEVYGQKEKYIHRDVLFYILEVLLKDASSVNELKNLNKVELFSLISLKSSQYIKNKEELHSFKITYLDAITIINDILKIRLQGDNFQNIDEKASRAFLDSMFKSENGIIDWFELIKQLRIRLGGLSGAIKQYMKTKFFLLDSAMVVPQMNTTSYLLNEDLIFQLQLSAHETKLKGAIKLELLYSNLVHNGGFKQMINNIIQSGLPTLILIQHEEIYEALHDKSNIQKTYTFGAVSNQRWFDTAQPQGDIKDCIFSLYPYFVVYQAKKDRTAKKNFCYLNTKDISKPQGIGFGFDDDKFRIWIDKDLNKSTCSSEDQSYESGDLVHRHIKKLKISVIEVWGIVPPAIEEQLDDPKIANAEQEFQQFEINTYEEAENQPLESKADYYWSNKQQEVKMETTGSNSFYWNNAQTAKPTLQYHSSLAKSQPNINPYSNQNLSSEEQKIADQLVGKNITNNYQQQEVVTQTIITRRSNLQRPVLDFKYQKLYEPEMIPKKEFMETQSQKHEIFGTNIIESQYPRQTTNEKVYSSASSLNQSKGRKTADQIIQDYESRKNNRNY